MARPNIPTLPDDKINYYREQLYQQLAHMFTWDGLPQTVPNDYIERNLVRHGYVLFYEEESIGLDVLRATVLGWNRHDLPVLARTWSTTTNSEVHPQIERTIKYLSDSEDSIEQFDPTKDGVLIMNMAFGENCTSIVDHFAQRLALVQQAFDTNLLWANVPYIFQTSSDETRLSIEKLFSDIFTGKPFTIVDKELFVDNKDRTGVPTGITFIGKDLMDVQNEIMMKFKQTVGFDTAGVEKAERVLQAEIDSNTQHTKSVLQIMLEQREKACEAINAFFGTNITVALVGQKELEEQAEESHEELEGGDGNGTGDSGTEEITSAE